MGEINLYGIYVPVLLIQAICAYLLFQLTAPWLHKWNSAGWIALPSIFHLCVYLMLLLMVHELFIGFGI